MSIHDPISNMLTSIRNGQKSNKIFIKIPYSKLKKNILKIMQEEGYIENFLITSMIKKEIQIYFKYFQGKPVIEKIYRLSKPSLRKYNKRKSIPYSLEGLGVVILTTSQGVMTDRKARILGIGGELLCAIE
ncbi:30S ribosomal protein S8 [Buchnera aphidicola]|uniref:30S ribosomal protein S8 n=1 Tax=Buchnera aphidicola TaxID=9 RepID=UPI0031B70697